MGRGEDKVTPSSEIATRRRRQIIDAAVAVIAEQGIQHLSLSEIERRTGMARGQLTYYFPHKEEILLAVFDGMVDEMRRRMAEADPSRCGPPVADLRGWPLAKYKFEHVLEHAPHWPEFGALQHTFLAQMAHRDDFRQRLADLFELWRSKAAEDLEGQLAEQSPYADRPSPRAVATVVQALIHGLLMQIRVDAEAFDRGEVLKLCTDLLGSLFRPTPPSGSATDE